MASTLVVKVQYDDTLRRFNASIKENGEMDLDMVALKAKILGLFDLPVDANVVLTYVDEDGDIVTLVDDNDLTDVMMQRLKFLRISVLLNNGRGAKPYARSSGGSTPMRSPRVPRPSDTGDVFGTSLLHDMPAVYKSVPDPIRETLHDMLSKLSVDLASKASPSSQVAGEIVDCVSKLGLSCLKNEQPSQGGLALERGKGATEVIMAPMPTAEESVPPEDDCQKDPAPKSEVKSSVDSFISGPHACAAAAVCGENEAKKQKAGFPVVKPLDYFTAARSALPVGPLTNDSTISGASAADYPYYAPKFHVPTIPFRKPSFSYDPKVGLFHKGVQCDGCGAHPIVGPRFKSKVKNDYDLCSICFTEMGKEGEYEVIERPIVHRHPRSFKGIHNMNKWMPPPAPPTLSPHMIRRNCLMKPAKSKLDSRFILDVNVLDGTMMGPSTSFTKIWRMRNSGTITWPHGARLVWIGGDKFSTADMVELEIPGEGLPIDGELDIAVDFISPQLPGRYISYWRMALPSGLKFGQRVWVLIQVDASVKEARDSSGGLNLNLPPNSALHNTSEVVDLKAQPAAEGGLMDQSNSATAPLHMTPMVVDELPKDQNLSFPIDDTLLVGPGAWTSPPPASAPPEAAATSTISYPIIDLLPEAASPGNTSAMTDGAKDVEATLLKELEEMGFKQVDLNKEVLRMNEYDLEQSVDALCGVAEWDPILEELQEMGFNDTEMNKKLLKKNNGSIKRVVMDLLTGEKA